MSKIKAIIKIKFNPREDINTLLMMVVLSFVQAVVINGFYTPYRFLSSGVTGISLLLNYTFNIPSWIPLVILNLPICIVGIIYLDAKFALFSTLGTVLYSTAIVLTNFVNFPEINPILAALAGGVILGVSGAPIVRRNATFGGMDILAMLFSRKTSLPMGTINIGFNLVIMAIQGIFNGLELAILSILAMFISNIAFNNALVGLNRTHTAFIISDEWDDIAPAIMKVVNRGVTYIEAEGAYSGRRRKLVYCILKTAELAKLKHVVMSIDPKAMFSVIDTKEVIGRGFGAIN